MTLQLLHFWIALYWRKILFSFLSVYCIMRCSRVWQERLTSNCRSRKTRNCPGFDPGVLRHSGIWGVADEAVLNIVHTWKIFKNPIWYHLQRGIRELCVSLIAASKSIISTYIQRGGRIARCLNRGFFMTLLHLPPLRFHCVGGCWDGSQVCCDCNISNRTL